MFLLQPALLLVDPYYYGEPLPPLGDADLDIEMEASAVAIVCLGILDRLFPMCQKDLQASTASRDAWLQELNAVKASLDVLSQLSRLGPQGVGDAEAAGALVKVDSLLAREDEAISAGTVTELKALQIQMQDLVILVCSRGNDQSLMKEHGIKQPLLQRLEEAFPQGLLARDEALWSRLGNAKFHVFQRVSTFGKRKKRRGRGAKPRKHPREISDAEGDALQAADAGLATPTAANDQALPVEATPTAAKDQALPVPETTPPSVLQLQMDPSEPMRVSMLQPMFVPCPAGCPEEFRSMPSTEVVYVLGPPSLEAPH